MNEFMPDQVWIDWCNNMRKQKSISILDLSAATGVSETRISKALRGLYDISERKKDEIAEFLNNAKPQKLYADPKMMSDLLHQCKEIGYSRKYFYLKIHITSSHFNNIVKGNVLVSEHMLSRIIKLMRKIIEE